MPDTREAQEIVLSAEELQRDDDFLTNIVEQRLADPNEEQIPAEEALTELGL